MSRPLVSELVAIVTASLVLLASGCAGGLKESPPAADLAGGPAPDAAEIDSLLSGAEALLALREVEKAEEAARLFRRAAAAGHRAPIEALLGAARASVWLTDHLADRVARERAAAAAVEAARWCANRAPLDPACAYWLGAALRAQAREGSATSSSTLPRIEEAFKRAAAAAPALDEGGPERALALLYLRAPGWPKGPGNPELGLAHARMAVSLRPAYPPNHLALAEALVATGDPKGSRAACARALDLAREMVRAGDRDAPEWIAEAGKGTCGAGEI